MLSVSFIKLYILVSSYIQRLNIWLKLLLFIYYFIYVKYMVRSNIAVPIFENWPFDAEIVNCYCSIGYDEKSILYIILSVELELSTFQLSIRTGWDTLLQDIHVMGLIRVCRVCHRISREGMTKKSKTWELRIYKQMFGRLFVYRSRLFFSNSVRNYLICYCAMRTFYVYCVLHWCLSAGKFNPCKNKNFKRN